MISILPSAQTPHAIVFVMHSHKLVDTVMVDMWHNICGKYSGAFVARQRNHLICGIDFPQLQV